MKRLLQSFVLAPLFAAPLMADPTYTKDGELNLPQGYEQWVFVGSNLALGYVSEPGADVFHNVYLETQAYLSFMETKEFPDKTQFLFEVYSNETREESGELTAGNFNGTLRAIEMAVKDSDRPIRPDSKELWAYYPFMPVDGTIPTTAIAQPDANCWACHDQHAGYDNVWVQFYPRLKARLAQD